MLKDILENINEAFKVSSVVLEKQDADAAFEAVKKVIDGVADKVISKLDEAGEGGEVVDETTSSGYEVYAVNCWCDRYVFGAVKMYDEVYILFDVSDATSKMKKIVSALKREYKKAVKEFNPKKFYRIGENVNLVIGNGAKVQEAVSYSGKSIIPIVNCPVVFDDTEGNSFTKYTSLSSNDIENLYQEITELL